MHSPGDASQSSSQSSPQSSPQSPPFHNRDARYLSFHSTVRPLFIFYLPTISKGPLSSLYIFNREEIHDVAIMSIYSQCVEGGKLNEAKLRKKVKLAREMVRAYKEKQARKILKLLWIDGLEIHYFLLREAHLNVLWFFDLAFQVRRVSLAGCELASELDSERGGSGETIGVIERGERGTTDSGTITFNKPLKSLREIDLSSMRLKAFPRMVGVKNLETVHIQYNEISVVPVGPGYEWTEEVKFIHLDYTGLKAIGACKFKSDIFKKVIGLTVSGVEEGKRADVVNLMRSKQVACEVD